MPVSENPGYDSHVGNNITTVFAFTFRIFEESDMLVELDGVAQTLTTDYTISAVGEGGNVIFVTAPGSGVVVNLSGEVPYDRSTDYIANGDFIEETVDADFDRTVVLCQQLAREFGRAFVLSYEDISGMTTLLPTPVADRFLAWNSGATAIEYIEPGSVEIAVPASESVTADMIDTGDTAAIRLKLDVMDTTTLTATYLAKAGGTMTGKIVLDGDATAELHPVSARQIQKGLLTNIVDTGAADAYIGTLAPAITVYTTRMVVGLVIANANLTTTPAFNLNSIGNDTIKRINSAALLVGDLPVGHLALLMHDGTDWILLNPALHTHGDVNQGGILTQSSFSAHKNGTNQGSITDTTKVKVTFGTELYDYQSNFASDKWTPPVGRIHIDACIQYIAAVGNFHSIIIRKNGVDFKSTAFTKTSSLNLSVPISIDDDANGTDYYEVFAYQTGGGTQTINGDDLYTFFNGHSLRN